MRNGQRGGARIVGGSIEQLLRVNFRKLDNWKKSGLLDAAMETIESGREKQVDIETVNGFGKTVFLSIHLSPFQLEEKPHVLLILEDVSENKRMEQVLVRTSRELEKNVAQLEQANRRIVEQQKEQIEEERLKALLEMAGATAHELNQPLQSLLGSIELITIYRDNPEKVSAYLGRIEADSLRMAAIVARILSIRQYNVRSYTAGSDILNIDQQAAILLTGASDRTCRPIRDLLVDKYAVTICVSHTYTEALRQCDRRAVALVIATDPPADGSLTDFLRALEDRKKGYAVIVVTDATQAPVPGGRSAISLSILDVTGFRPERLVPIIDRILVGPGPKPSV